MTPFFNGHGDSRDPYFPGRMIADENTQTRGLGGRDVDGAGGGSSAGSPRGGNDGAIPANNFLPVSF